MNTRERFNKIMNFEPCDRTIIWEFGYWAGAIKRWYEEGMPRKDGIPEDLYHTEVINGTGLYWPTAMSLHPKGKSSPIATDANEFFKLDQYTERIPINLWFDPEFDIKIIDEDNDKKIILNEWGIKQVIKKQMSSPPGDLSFPVKNRKDWEELKSNVFNKNLKERLPGNWNELVENRYKNSERPLMFGGYPCGFYGSLRKLIGDIGVGYLLYDDPKLIKDIISFLCDFWIDLYGEVLNYITPDWCLIWEDMSYNCGSIISPQLFREIFLPQYKRLTGFLKHHGLKNIIVDSDGNSLELIPLWIEGGITGHYPLEQCCPDMNILNLRKKFPNLQLFGGINKKVISKDKNAIDIELNKISDVIKQGGYIPYADHCIVEDVPLENMIYYRDRLRDIIENTKVLGQA